MKQSAFDVIGIAASMGGLRALTHLVASLPDDFPAAIVIVQHLYPQGESFLPQILHRHTVLTVKHAVAGELLRAGTIYVAQPNWHLALTATGIFALTQTDRINFVRPSADCLFESLAQYYGPRAIAVVLTGRGRDGANGIKAVQQQGGTTIAQDALTADFSGMPSAAIETHAVKFILPLQQIAETLVKLVEG